METPPMWVKQAAGLPVAFAQVREDALLDLAVADTLSKNSAVLMVASGGCTAAALVRHRNIARVKLVDPNPAQLAIARLKLHMVAHCNKEESLQLLGHRPMSAQARAEAIGRLWNALGLRDDVLGEPATLAQLGLDHCGRYERLFAAMRHELAGAGVLIALEPLRPKASPAFEAAFERVMALPNLVALFGQGATANPVIPFATHFAKQTRFALSREDAPANPYLGQVLLGRYPEGSLPPWLAQEWQGPLAQVSWRLGTMADALAEGERYALIHLSNILDWLTLTEATALLHAAWRALKPGGRVIIRQLNSALDIRGIDTPIQWLADESDRLLQRDRSYFYRAIHLGTRA